VARNHFAHSGTSSSRDARGRGRYRPTPEDDLTAGVLLPFFRQLGFHRVTAAGHENKALEDCKDVWMKFTAAHAACPVLWPTSERDKVAASGTTKDGNANIAEIHNQVMMMLGHQTFPEIGKRVLVDHAFIAAGAEIMKAARNWLEISLMPQNGAKYR